MANEQTINLYGMTTQELISLHLATISHLLAVTALPEEPDRLVDVEEAGKILCQSADWVRHNAEKLGFGVRNGANIRCSLNGIQRYIEQRLAR